LSTRNGAPRDPAGALVGCDPGDPARAVSATRACLLCGGTDHRPVFHEDGLDVLRCLSCQHVFSSFDADPHYEDFWGSEVPDDEHVYWSRARRQMHQDFARRFLVGRSGRLLDMGCGLGFFLEAASAYPGWERQGCEISPAAARYARQKLGQSVLCTRLEDAELPRGSFDLVTLWDVLEHLLRPDPLLRRCHDLLRPGGACFIRSPNVAVHLPRARLARLLPGTPPSVGYLQPRHHLHHYSTASLRRLLERNGFSRIEFVHLRPIQRPGLAGRVQGTVFQAVRTLASVTGGRLNLDNLFVVAHK
jgi:SAM-dependent methyltransferase